MTKKQEAQLTQLWNFIQQHISSHQVVTRWEPEQRGSDVYLKVFVESSSDIPTNSVLRIFDMESWVMRIGKLGGTDVIGCPRSCEQFAGRYAFGLYFTKNVRRSPREKKPAVERVKAHSLFSVWSPDEVAECLDGVPSDLCSRLWELVSAYDGQPRSEVPDDFGSRALVKQWNKLDVGQQKKLNELAKAYDEKMGA